jgi:transposase
MIATARRPGRPTKRPALSAELEALRPHEVTIRPWLKDDELRLTKVHRRLRAQGVHVSYSSLYRFARAVCDFGTPAVTVRVAEPPPGEAAEVDFGVLGLWFDPLVERQRRMYGLLVTLCFSRYAFLAVGFRQDLPAVLEGLEAAWLFFGGVVRRLVADNLKPVITRPDRYDPHVNRVFLEYALSFAKTPSGGQVVDLSALIRKNPSPVIILMLHLLRLLPVRCGSHRQLALENLATAWHRPGALGARAGCC